MAESIELDRNLDVELLYKHSKHLTVLSTISIVSLVTFYSGKTGIARLTDFAIIAIFLWVVCIVGNGVATGLYVVKAEAEEGLFARGRKTSIVRAMFMLSLLAFVMAMVAFGAFAIESLS